MTTFTYSELYDLMKKTFIANQDRITDFNDGSVISSIFESVARIVERLYIETRIGYNNNLKAIPYSMFEFEKKDGSRAISTGHFIASTPADVDIIINVGTKVSSGALIFETTEKATILAGETESNDVKILAEKVGSDYNLAVNTITNIDSLVPYNVVSFTNTTKSEGGLNTETDTEMLSRFKTMINGLQGTNSYGMKAAILKEDGVRSVSIVEHFPPQDSFNFSIYVDDGSGGTELSDELKDKINTIIKGENTETNPGHKAAGVNYRLGAASPKYVDVTCKCQIYRTSHSTAEYDATEAIKETINNLTIGENLLVTSLILALRQISYIKDVTSLTLNGVAGENVTANPDQICRFGSVSFVWEDVNNDY